MCADMGKATVPSPATKLASCRRHSATIASISSSDRTMPTTGSHPQRSASTMERSRDRVRCSITSDAPNHGYFCSVRGIACEGVPHRDGEMPARLQDPAHLPKRRPPIAEEHHAELADHRIERIVRVRKRLGGTLPPFHLRGQSPCDLEHAWLRIETTDARPGSPRRRSASRASTPVPQARSRTAWPLATRAASQTAGLQGANSAGTMSCSYASAPAT